MDILIGLAAENDEVHAGEAIPQIVMLFDDEDIFEKIREAKTSQDIYNLIEEKA